MNKNIHQRGCQPDPIACTQTFHSPGCTVHVHFPDISDEENERRMKLIKKSAAELIKEKIKLDRERERKHKELEYYEEKTKQR